MRGFAGSSTSALLQKASAQLSGGKVPATFSSVSAAVDDDGLAVSVCCCWGSASASTLLLAVLYGYVI